MCCVLRGVVWWTPPGLNRITHLADLAEGIPVVLNVLDRRPGDQPSYPFNFTRPWHMHVCLGDDAFRIPWKFHRLVHDVRGAGGYTRCHLETTVGQKGRRILLGPEPSRNVDTQICRGHVVYRGGAGV